MPERVIFNGQAGTKWVNDTPKVRYQFVASMRNTCGACMQYHMAIGPYWPIFLHHRCRCRQYPIAVGAEAPHAFVNFRELLADLPHSQQVKAIGASNYKLLQAGVVEWKEVVTQFRVRTLREVLALNKISLKTALKAGVKEKWIAAAHADVHAPEAEMIRQHRQELIDKLKARGVSQQQLVHEISRGLVGQVQIIGSSGVQTMEPFVATIPHGEGLAAALAAWRPDRQGGGRSAERGGRTRPKPPPPAPTQPAPTQSPTPPKVPPSDLPPFHEQVTEALAQVPEARLIGDKAWIHDVHAAHQANPVNPRLTLEEFKALLVEDENRAKLTLGRADLAHRMNQADVAASQVEVKIGDRTAATFNFIRPKKQ